MIEQKSNAELRVEQAEEYVRLLMPDKKARKRAPDLVMGPVWAAAATFALADEIADLRSMLNKHLGAKHVDRRLVDRLKEKFEAGVVSTPYVPPPEIAPKPPGDRPRMGQEDRDD